MDPFHQRRRGPDNDFGHPGLPRYTTVHVLNATYSSLHVIADC